MTLCSLALAWLLVGQVPSDAVPINSRSFGIPITVDPSQRAQIKNLLLFSSPDQGKTWNQESSATPDQQQFRFNAPSDGLYWFSVIVVDTKGIKTPPDPYQSTPAQKILIDTRPPLVKTLNAERPGDEAVVAWDILEEHADLATLHVEYRPQDAAAGAPWYTISLPAPQLKGEARFKPTSPGAVAVRMEIKDMAGNSGGKEALVPPAAAPAAPPPPPPPSMIAVTGPGTPAVAAIAPAAPGAAAPLPPAMPVGREPVPPSPFGATAMPAASGRRVIASAGPGADEVIERTSHVEPSALPLPRAQLVNGREISLEYEVHSGPSGLGKVELWMTKDDGHSWEFLTDDPDMKSPINATLPGEGVFGLRMMVQSGAGLSKGQPQPGDAPEMRIEVDLRPPWVQLHEPQPDQYLHDALVITWSASDRNLAPRPVRIEYSRTARRPVAARGGGPSRRRLAHLAVAAKRAVPCYLRIVAVDVAGNRTVAQTREPVLIDLTKPEARLWHRRRLKKTGEVPPPEGAPATSGASGMAPPPSTGVIRPLSATGSVPPPPEGEIRTTAGTGDVVPASGESTVHAPSSIPPAPSFAPNGE